jgi:hypothetical protein
VECGRCGGVERCGGVWRSGEGEEKSAAEWRNVEECAGCEAEKMWGMRTMLSLGRKINFMIFEKTTL